MLTIWADTDPGAPLLQTSDRDLIGAELREIGVDYALLEGAVELAFDATPDEIIAAHQGVVDRLIEERGYTLVDAVQLHLHEDSPAELKEAAAGARQKFLAEHTHDEEEIRFFSHGSGVFYLHIDGRVLAVLCTAGDLISVPAMTTHWFDMGTLPDFTAIRFFRTDDGWVGTFTGSDIALSFPTFDELSEVATHG